MMLADAGPLVALFDPRDAAHAKCRERLQSVEEPLATTIPVLTEALHLLTPASTGAQRLMDFIIDGGLSVWFLDDAGLQRAFELMTRYASVPMDLADASLVAAAERFRTRRVFTIDRRDFGIYRIRRGHRQVAFQVFD